MLTIVVLYCLVTVVVSECPPSSGIYLMYDGVCYTSGSYFLNGPLSTTSLICGHSDVGGGQWLYPDGTTCTNTSSPIHCTHNDTDGNTIVLRRGTGSFDIDDELGYTCCLPHNCNNANTDMIMANIFRSIYILDVTVELPPDVTAIPQMYKVNCIIAGSIVNRGLNFSYSDAVNVDLTDSICTNSDGFSCTATLDNGDDDNGVSGLTSDITPNALRHGLLTVIWEAEKISSGVFRQNNNNGDHRIRCSAQRGDAIIRYSDYITIRAPLSRPSNVTVLSIVDANITITWTYDTNDADGYVIYYNSVAKTVEGGDMKEATLAGLMPGMNYSVIVRAYQDILGPPSTPLEIPVNITVPTINVSLLSSIDDLLQSKYLLQCFSLVLLDNAYFDISGVVYSSSYNATANGQYVSQLTIRVNQIGVLAGHVGVIQCVGTFNSELHSLATALNAPSGPPSNINVEMNKPYSLNVTWSTTSNTKGYVCAYSNSTGNYTQQVYTNTATISPVTLGSTYIISVYAYHDLLSKESDAIYIFYDVPSAVNSVSIESESTSQLFVSWPPHNDSSYIEYYNISYTPTACSTANSGNAIVLYGTHQYIINGLCTGVNYTIAILAGNILGHSSLTKVTGETISSKPTTSPILLKQAHPISWIPVDCHEHNGRFVGYILSISNINETTTFNLTTTETYAFPNNLVLGNVYIIRVALVNSVGIGPFSNALEITIKISEGGCLPDVDKVWGISWPAAVNGVTETQKCVGKDVTGFASRLCNSTTWSSVDVSNCSSKILIVIHEEASMVFKKNHSNLTGEEIEEIAVKAIALTEMLAEVTNTSGSGIRLFPTDLSTANYILINTIAVLNASFTANNKTAGEATSLVDTISNILHLSNMAAWESLQTTNPSMGSELLLQNAEDLGLYLATTLIGKGSQLVVSRENMVISIKALEVDDDTTFTDITFPDESDLINFTASTISRSNMPLASIVIPESVLHARADGRSTIPVANMIFNNLQEFLHSANTSDNIRPGSIILSSQVASSHETPSLIVITFSIITNDSVNQNCVFWEFDNRIGEGIWSNEGIHTVTTTEAVMCLSSHLTSFAVLVDVADAHEDIAETEAVALSVVTYIGLSISVVCLLLTVLFFLSFGKQLLISVHYFVHFNLALCLLLGYLVFIAGVESAKNNKIGCTLVAALLHYFLLSSFCWMLCEGIMLYLMLVLVFSSLSKKWWLFLIIGWIPSLVIVVTIVGATNSFYTDKEDFCWLSVKRNVIWGFVAPMCVIIIINTFILVAVIYNIISKSSKLSKNIALIRFLLTSSIILLPLLGLTWIFGLLAIAQQTSLFAWIFCVLNSLQGVAIFFFHVVRNDKVWKKLAKIHRKFQTAFTRAPHTKVSISLTTLGAHQQNGESMLRSLDQTM